MFSFGLPAMIIKVFRRIFSLFLKKIYSRVIMRGGLIEVRAGLIVRRRLCFYEAQTRCISVDQTLFMQLVKMYTLRAVVYGEYSSKDKKVVLLPICSRKEAEERMASCFEKFLKAEDMICLIGRHWLRKRELYCTRDNIGLIKISKNIFKKGYKLKTTVRSQTGYKTKIGFPTKKEAENYIKMHFFDFSEHNNTK